MLYTLYTGVPPDIEGGRCTRPHSGCPRALPDQHGWAGEGQPVLQPNELVPLPLLSATGGHLQVHGDHDGSKTGLKPVVYTAELLTLRTYRCTTLACILNRGYLFPPQVPLLHYTFHEETSLTMTLLPHWCPD